MSPGVPYFVCLGKPAAQDVIINACIRQAAHVVHVHLVCLADCIPGLFGQTGDHSLDQTVFSENQCRLLHKLISPEE